MSFAGRRRTSYLALAAAVARGLSARASTTPASKAKPISSSGATTVPNAAAVYQLMGTSAAAAKSVHIKGALIQKGQKLQIDVAGERAGKNTRVIVNEGTTVIEILTTGGTTYLKANAAYWTKNASAATAKLAADKSVTIPAGSVPVMDSLQVGTLPDKTLAKDMTAVQKLNTEVEKTEVNGSPPTSSRTRSRATAARSMPRPTAGRACCASRAPKAQGSLDFTKWDAVRSMSPPPADQLVKLVKPRGL